MSTETSALPVRADDNMLLDPLWDDHVIQERVVAFYHQRLREYAPAQQYLKRRGLDDAQMIDHFQLGFADRALGRAMPRAGSALGKEIRSRLQSVGLYRESGHGHHNGCVVVPVCNDAGHLQELYGRKIAAGFHRQWNGCHLYLSDKWRAEHPERGVLNAASLSEGEDLILCDSVLNALTFWRAGHRNVTCSWGLPPVLSPSEMERVLSQADVTTRLGIRDRAILETFYSTGIRRSELIHLQVHDVDYERGTLLVRQGKGRKDRVVPIGERALAWIEKYMQAVRDRLCPNPEQERTLFVTKDGEVFSGTRMCVLVSRYLQASEVRKRGSCHLLRHTMATLMLENGADVRFIQAILGHVKLETTQVYTQVSIRKLQEIHRATHPAQMPGKSSKSEKTTDTGGDESN